jgi:general secretion pathway protein G
VKLTLIMKTKLNSETPIASRLRRARQGFTLVELLLVLVILGILAAIVIPKFSGRTEQAKEQAAVTQISSFSTALNNFEVDNGYYPKTLQDLIAQPRDAQNWHGPYLQTDRIPVDPWGQEYHYECPGRNNPKFFDLSSAGPPQGDKVIANWTVQKR